MIAMDYAAPTFWENLFNSAAIAIAALLFCAAATKAMSGAQSGFPGLAAQMPDSVVITDPDGKITYVNPPLKKPPAAGRGRWQKAEYPQSGKHDEAFTGISGERLQAGRSGADR